MDVTCSVTSVTAKNVTLRLLGSIFARSLGRSLPDLLGRVQPSGDQTALRARRAQDLVVRSGKGHQDRSVNHAPDIEARGQSRPVTSQGFVRELSHIASNRCVSGGLGTHAAFDKSPGKQLLFCATVTRLTHQSRLPP